MTTVETLPTLAQAVRALASVCDGAQTRDQRGFDGVDSRLGKSVALVPEPLWDAQTKRVVWDMLRKYREQLDGFGIDYDAIPEPAEPSENGGNARLQVAHKASRLIRIVGERAFVQFRYDETVHRAVRTLPDRRWLGKHTGWVVPSRHRRELEHIAAKHGFRIEGEWPTGQSAAPARRRRILLEDGKFVVEMPFEMAAIEVLRAIPGREMDRARASTLGKGMSCWRIPTRGNVAAVVAFARQYDLALPPEIEAAARKAEERAESLKTASMALDADIQVDGLGDGLSLLPYQRGGVAYMTRVRRGWIADSMGLGKTVQAIATVQYDQAFPVVCVVPAAVKINWAREWRKWVPGLQVEVINGNRRGYVGLFGPAHVYVINYDILGTFDPQTEKMTGHLVDFVETVKPRALIVDESQFVKEAGTLRTQAVMRLGQAVRDAHGKEALVVLLSGTPLVNRPKEMITQLDVMGRLNEFGGQSRFKARYCKTEDNLTELHDRLRASCYVRRLTKDVLKDLPPIRRIPVEAELDPAVMAEYRKAEEDVANFLAERARELALESGLDDEDARRAYWEKKLKTESAEQLVLIGTLKQLLAKAKLPWARRWVDNFHSSTDGKLLVFAWHTPIVKGLADHLKCPTIDGNQSLPQRQAVVDNFQTDPKVKTCVLNIQAGGVGLTLTAAESVAFLEQGWTPGEHDQAEGRCYGRVNEAHGATSYYLLAMSWEEQETIDAMIFQLVQSKRQVVNAVADGITPDGSTSVLGEVVLNLARRGLKGEAA